MATKFGSVYDVHMGHRNLAERVVADAFKKLLAHM
jgi:hypothetical protein